MRTGNERERCLVRRTSYGNAHSGEFVFKPTILLVLVLVDLRTTIPLFY